VAVSYTSREQIEVYRFNWAVAVAVPLSAIFLQAFVPRWIPSFSTYFDLPLLVVIFFAMARRSQVMGLITGAVIGLVQDSLTPHPLGMYGIAQFDAVINPPQASILAVGKAEKRPIVKKDKLKIATMMSVTLSVDHRVIDGALGAELLAGFKSFIEDPVTMLV